MQDIALVTFIAFAAGVALGVCITLMLLAASAYEG